MSPNGVTRLHFFLELVWRFLGCVGDRGGMCGHPVRLLVNVMQDSISAFDRASYSVFLLEHLSYYVDSICMQLVMLAHACLVSWLVEA